MVNTRLEDEESKKRRDECKYGQIRLRSWRANEDRARDRNGFPVKPVTQQPGRQNPFGASLVG